MIELRLNRFLTFVYRLISEINYIYILKNKLFYLILLEHFTEYFSDTQLKPSIKEITKHDFKNFKIYCDRFCSG